MIGLTALFVSMSQCAEITAVETPIAPLTLTVPDTGTGDGASVIAISATVDSSIPPEKRVVAFSTTAGNFDGSATAMVTSDSERIARTYLTPPGDTTTAYITATIGTSSQQRTIAFKRARPDTITVSLSAFSLVAGATASIGVATSLERLVGHTSPGLPIGLTAHLADGSSVGSFGQSHVFSNAQGVDTARFTLGIDSVAGIVTIVATTLSSQGLEISDSAAVVVSEPTGDLRMAARKH